MSAPQPKPKKDHKFKAAKQELTNDAAGTEKSPKKTHKIIDTFHDIKKSTEDEAGHVKVGVVSPEDYKKLKGHFKIPYKPKFMDIFRGMVGYTSKIKTISEFTKGILFHSNDKIKLD